MSVQDESTLQAIHRLLLEIVENGQKIRNVKTDLKDIAEQNDEWRALREDIKELKTKQVEAKKLLEADKDYQIINSELGELKFKHKDLLEIMSHHLMEYRDSTGEDHIKDPEGEARQIITEAKIGKPDPLLVDGGRPRASNKPIKGQVSMESSIEGYGNPGGAPLTDGKSLAAGEGKE